MKLRTKFQDEDFELGEVVEGVIVESLGRYEKGLRVITTAAKGGQHTFCYSSIKKFMDDWEDAQEEPKKYWYITGEGVICRDDIKHSEWIEERKAIGNYFEIEEEAKRAAEKLKAFTRLKERGFRFVGWQDSVSDNNPDMALFKLDEHAWEASTCDDLDLLFSGEDD